MFAGQGSQYFGMGRELFDSHAAFRDCMIRLDGLFAEAGLPKTLAEIYRPDRRPSHAFDDLRFTHPAILMIELSLLETARAEGLQPDVVLGASLGEYAARPARWNSSTATARP